LSPALGVAPSGLLTLLARGLIARSSTPLGFVQR
jgi:hypothetical protein